MKKLPYVICMGLLMLVSCTEDKHVEGQSDERTTDEEQGAVMLDQARQLLAQGNTAAARDTILSLRKHHPLALNARKQAILTLDSIEWEDAKAQGDSLKTEFYQRKIQFDKKN